MLLLNNEIIIENNQDFIVINKPANVDFHCEGKKLGIVAQVSKALEGIPLFPVHRLDKMTSGLLILAKSSEVAAKFGMLFQQRLMSKYYLAISDNKPKKKQGLIKGDMKKGRNGSYLLLKTMNNPAITQFFSVSIAPQRRLFLLKPHTGKTHQLRVAMKSLGAPILGDPRYYPNNREPIGMLHAWQLAFTLDEQDYQFVAQPDWSIEGLPQQLDVLAQPSELHWPTL